MSRPLTTIADEGAEPFPEGWRDEIVCHTIRRNSDGSITAVILINVYDDTLRMWSAERTVKLPKLRGPRKTRESINEQRSR